MSYASDTELEDYLPLVGKSQRKSAAGRELIRWDPEKDQLALLCTDYVCTTEGVAIPWDKIAELMGRLVGKHSMTGEAIKQHLAKLHRFRDEADQLVPPKLDRHQRRKPVTAAKAHGTSAAPRGRRRARNDDEDEDAALVAPVQPGKSLLYSKPVAKSKKSPRTPATGRNGRRKSRAIDEFQDDGGDDYDHDPVPKRRVAAANYSSSKRGRKAKSNVRVEDDEQDTAFPTPARTPKRLRPQAEVNYSEQAFEDHDDQDVTPEHSFKQEQYHSPPNNDYYQSSTQYLGRVLPSNGYDGVHQANYVFGAVEDTSPFRSSSSSGNTPGTASGGLRYDQQTPYQLQTPRSITTPTDLGDSATFPRFGQGHLNGYPGFEFPILPQFSMNDIGRAANLMLDSQPERNSNVFGHAFAEPKQTSSAQHDSDNTPAQYDHTNTYLPAYGIDALQSADHFLAVHPPRTKVKRNGNGDIDEHLTTSHEHGVSPPHYSFDSGLFDIGDGDSKGALDESFGQLLNDQASFT
ncbi:hypothetical protein LTR78_003757 [Recurvomyces mirabilis]|uniref:Uncharacterized protein n=1 Tax=Recurvomyces mirabilis TaxID=574656 RepID=A0AAE1C384_9PEZI|nr:hypothetical protein LTR78_003757 [Recurvomyces mirabilis]KAK5154869.1 hypothetical protein LTS14_006450 [Recurvomyces mirabilis]